MLHVKVDVVRWGVESWRETLTEVFIGNDSTGTKTVGNYDVYTEDPREKPYPREARSGYVGRIEGFPRDPGQSHAGALAAAALELAEAHREGHVSTDVTVPPGDYASYVRRSGVPIPGDLQVDEHGPECKGCDPVCGRCPETEEVA